MLDLFFVYHKFGGIGTYCKELITQLKKRNDINIFVIYLDDSRNEFKIQKDQNEIKITNIYFPKVELNNQIIAKYYRNCCLVLQQFINKNKPTIFHFNKPTDYYIALELIKFQNIKIVYTVHYLDSFHSFIEVAKTKCNETVRVVKEEQKIISISHKVICVTAFAKKVIVRFYNKEIEKVGLVYNGFAVSNIGRNEDSSIFRANVKSKLGFNSDERILLYVGTVNEAKGIYTLIDVFKKLASEFSNLRLVIAGKGEIEKACKKCCGIWGKVSFTGIQDKEVLNDLYSIADIGVVPSLVEQCSYVVLEMMQKKVPMVISATPGLNELSDNGNVALSTEVYALAENFPLLSVDQNDLFNKIKILLDDKQKKKKLCYKAYNQFIKKYNAKNMSKETFNIYKTLHLE